MLKTIEKIEAMNYNIFSQLRSEKKLCDAVITADGVEFHAHKIILCGCTEYFRALFNRYPPDQQTYNIPGVSAHIMELIIEHAYGCQVTITEGNVRELLVAADALEVSELVNKCNEILKAQMRPETCIGIWRFSHYYYLEKLKQKAFQMILCDFEEIMRISDEFLDLKVEELIKIIENDNLKVESENVVFDSVVKWTSHALQERKAQIRLLVPKVRVGLLTRDYLMDKVKNNILMTKDAELRTIINSALLKRHLRRYFTRPRLPMSILLAIGNSLIESATVIEAYDSRADRWVRVTCSYKISRHHYGTVFLNGFVYCIGGCLSRGTFLNDVRQFNPITKTWAKVRSMHYRRSHVAVCVLDGQIYVMGGIDINKYMNTVERYNPEDNQWNMIAPMQQQRKEAGAAALNGKVYVCGGCGGHDDYFLCTVEYYSPQTGQWTYISRMNSGRSAAGVTEYGGELYVVGGEDSFLTIGSAEVYDPQTNSWRYIPDMITHRRDFGIGVIDDRLFVVGGFNSSGPTREVEYYDRKTATWCAVKNMRICCRSLSCCVVSGLPNMLEYITSQDDVKVSKNTLRKKRRTY